MIFRRACPTPLGLPNMRMQQGRPLPFKHYASVPVSGYMPQKPAKKAADGSAKLESRSWSGIDVLKTIPRELQL